MANVSDFTENLFESIDTIINKRIENIKYDKTILCKIIDTSNRKNGEYLVSNDSVSFNAYSTETYSKGTQVYVTIPQGDYNNRKIIIGKYVEDSDTDSYIGQEDEDDTFIDVSGENILSFLETDSEIKDKLNQGTSIRANNNVLTEQIFSASNINNLLGYHKLKITADFSTSIQSQLASGVVIAGNYGLLIKINGYKELDDKIKDETVPPEANCRYAQFDSSEMYGNPYNYINPVKQQKIFDISEYKKITNLEIYLYQNNNFTVITGSDSAPQTLEPNDENDIFVKNIDIRLAYDASLYKSNIALLTTPSASTYNDGIDGHNIKNVTLHWLKDENGKTKIIDSNEGFENYSDEYDISWYTWIFNENVIDDELGMFWCNINKLVYNADTKKYIYTTKDNIQIDIDTHNITFDIDQTTETDDDQTTETDDDQNTETDDEQTTETDDLFRIIINSNNDLPDIRIKAVIKTLNEKAMAMAKDRVAAIKESDPDSPVTIKDVTINDDTEKKEYYWKKDNFVYYISEELVFTNNSATDMNQVVDLIRGLSLSVDDGYNGRYNIYGEDGGLINQSEAFIRRRISAHYNSVISGYKEFDDDETIIWKIPKTNTMIQPLEQTIISTKADGKDYIETQGDYLGEKVDENGNTVYKELFTEPPAPEGIALNFDFNNYYYIIRTVNIGNPDSESSSGAEISNTVSQTFRLNYYYDQNFTNNIITCYLIKNNLIHEANYQLSFGPSGTNGTNYTLVVEPAENKTYLSSQSSLDEDGTIYYDTLKMRITLYDGENKIIPLNPNNPPNIKFLTEDKNSLVKIIEKENSQSPYVIADDEGRLFFNIQFVPQGTNNRFDELNEKPLISSQSIKETALIEVTGTNNDGSLSTYYNYIFENNTDLKEKYLYLYDLKKYRKLSSSLTLDNSKYKKYSIDLNDINYFDYTAKMISYSASDINSDNLAIFSNETFINADNGKDYTGSASTSENALKNKFIISNDDKYYKLNYLDVGKKQSGTGEKSFYGVNFNDNYYLDNSIIKYRTDILKTIPSGSVLLITNDLIDTVNDNLYSYRIVSNESYGLITQITNSNNMSENDNNAQKIIKNQKIIFTDEYYYLKNGYYKTINAYILSANFAASINQDDTTAFNSYFESIEKEAIPDEGNTILIDVDILDDPEAEPKHSNDKFNKIKFIKIDNKKDENKIYADVDNSENIIFSVTLSASLKTITIYISNKMLINYSTGQPFFSNYYLFYKGQYYKFINLFINDGQFSRPNSIDDENFQLYFQNANITGGKTPIPYGSTLITSNTNYINTEKNYPFTRIITDITTSNNGKDIYVDLPLDEDGETSLVGCYYETNENDEKIYYKIKTVDKIDGRYVFTIAEDSSYLAKYLESEAIIYGNLKNTSSLEFPKIYLKRQPNQESYNSYFEEFIGTDNDILNINKNTEGNYYFKELNIIGKYIKPVDNLYYQIKDNISVIPKYFDPNKMVSILDENNNTLFPKIYIDDGIYTETEYNGMATYGIIKLPENKKIIDIDNLRNDWVVNGNEIKYTGQEQNLTGYYLKIPEKIYFKIKKQYYNGAGQSSIGFKIFNNDYFETFTIVNSQNENIEYNDSITNETHFLTNDEKVQFGITDGNPDIKYFEGLKNKFYKFNDTQYLYKHIKTSKTATSPNVPIYENFYYFDRNNLEKYVVSEKTINSYSPPLEQNSIILNNLQQNYQQNLEGSIRTYFLEPNTTYTYYYQNDDNKFYKVKEWKEEEVYTLISNSNNFNDQFSIQEIEPFSNENINAYIPTILEVSTNIYVNNDVENNGQYLKLTNYYPVPINLTSNNYVYSGPNKVIYNADGSKVSYYANPIKLLNLNEAEQPELFWAGKVYLKGNELDWSYPQLIGDKNNQVLKPCDIFISANTSNSNNKPDAYYIYGKDDKGEYVWIQPILIMQDVYKNSLLNAWTGKLKISEDDNAILSATMVAGKKEQDNSFTGLVMGKDSQENQIGMYGYRHGASVFAFKEDGTAYIGPSGSGRIEFDGNKGQIKSSKWDTKEHQGLCIDLDDGLIQGTKAKLSFESAGFDENGESISRTFVIDSNAKDYPLNVNNQFKVNWNGSMEATAGIIGGWTIGSQTLSKLFETGRGIQLDPTNGIIVSGRGGFSQRNKTFTKEEAGDNIISTDNEIDRIENNKVIIKTGINVIGKYYLAKDNNYYCIKKIDIDETNQEQYFLTEDFNYFVIETYFNDDLNLSEKNFLKIDTNGNIIGNQASFQDLTVQNQINGSCNYAARAGFAERIPDHEHSFNYGLEPSVLLSSSQDEIYESDYETTLYCYEKIVSSDGITFAPKEYGINVSRPQNTTITVKKLGDAGSFSIPVRVLITSYTGTGKVYYETQSVAGSPNGSTIPIYIGSHIDDYVTVRYGTPAGATQSKWYATYG